MKTLFQVLPMLMHDFRGKDTTRTQIEHEKEIHVPNKLTKIPKRETLYLITKWVNTFSVCSVRHA